MEPVSLYDMRSIGDAVSPLSEAFFSDQNINVIQQKLKKIVYDASDGKFTIPDQPVDELKQIMIKNITGYGGYPDTYIKEQIAQLNESVIWSIKPSLLSNIQQYILYIRDASSLVTPPDLPEDTSITGTQTLYTGGALDVPRPSQEYDNCNDCF